MIDYDNGKIHGWNGGWCPLHPKSEVQVWFRDGEVRTGHPDRWVWRHDSAPDDIIAFRVTKVHVEPNTIYVVRDKTTGAIIGASDVQLTPDSEKYVQVLE